MDIPSYEFLLKDPSRNTTKKYFRTNYSEVFKIIDSLKPKRWIEKLYWFYNNITDYPRCECGNFVNFRDFRQGYRHFCSLKCSRNSEDTIEKLKNTNIERYGVEWNLSDNNIRNKAKQTCLEKYGVEHYTNREQSKQTCLEKYGVEFYGNKEKAKQTCLEKYGVDCNLKLDSNKEKSKQTCLEKYGVEHYTNREQSKQTCLEKYNSINPFSNSEIQSKAKQTKFQNYQNQNNIISFSYDSGRLKYICRCNHQTCKQCDSKQFEIYADQYSVRKSKGVELCTNLLPIQYDKISNTSIESFVRNILNEYNITYYTNVRNIITPKELDIYIPEKKLAIECNGCYWHSTKEKKYHNNKYKCCEALGIQLLTFWDDQITRTPDIVKSIILSKLGIYSIRIGARKCKICELDNQIYTDFVNKYHIQGAISALIKIGLFYNNELVSVMSFGKNRFGVGEWELLRYCCKSGIQIVGGVKKLFNYFLSKCTPNEIISFSSNDISTGKLYSGLGFSYEKETIGYWYIDKHMNRYHRIKFQKHKIVDSNNCNLTEEQIMRNNEYIKIYDSGQKKFRIVLNKL